MDYSFNGQYGFPWTPNAYNLQNQFNTPPNAFTSNGTAAGPGPGPGPGTIQPFSTSNAGVFNTQGIYGAPRYPPGLMPFGNFVGQSGNQNSQNSQFGPNWNFGFPNQNPNPVMNTFNNVQQPPESITKWCTKCSTEF